MVSTAAVQFDQTGRYFRRYEVTGVPVRPAFFEIAPRSDEVHPPTLLIFGGSQGAHAINQAVIDALPVLQKKLPGLRIIHQTGERDFNDAQAAYQRANFSAEVSAFIHDMLLDGMAHARVVRQPGRGATLETVDETAIKNAARTPIAFVRAGTVTPSNACVAWPVWTNSLPIRLAWSIGIAKPSPIEPACPPPKPSEVALSPAQAAMPARITRPAGITHFVRVRIVGLLNESAARGGLRDVAFRIAVPVCRP